MISVHVRRANLDSEAGSTCNANAHAHIRGAGLYLLSIPFKRKKYCKFSRQGDGNFC